jgi:hypothetical protein
MTNVKDEIDKTVEKLAKLRDEVKLHLHLASQDAKKEWDDKLEPRVRQLDEFRKEITESSASTLRELVEKMEKYLARIRTSDKKSA